MKSLKNLRDAIIRAHERGKKQVEIAEFLGISTSTVNDAIKRYKETGNNEDRKGRGRKKTARSRKNVQCAKGMIKRNPTTRANSTRKLAKKLDVSEASARRILKKDLNLKPFKFQKRQKLNAQTKLKRLQCAQALYRRFSRGRHRQIVFSDEKLFDIQQVGLRVLLVFIFFFRLSTIRTTEFGRKKHFE